MRSTAKRLAEGGVNSGTARRELKRGRYARDRTALQAQLEVTGKVGKGGNDGKSDEGGDHGNRALPAPRATARLPRKDRAFTAVQRRDLSVAMAGVFAPERLYEDLRVWSFRRRDGRGSP